MNKYKKKLNMTSELVLLLLFIYSIICKEVNNEY